MNDARSWPAWPAIPGPVFRRELGSAARGRRLYLIRVLAAGVLAWHVGSSVPLREGLIVAESWSPGRVAQLATRAVRAFETSQFVVVLAMVPLLVAGSVAEEKARGTLGLILAGRLSSLEIVADKLAARMLMVLVLVLAGLPVLALIGLLGGGDPGELALVYGLTLSTTWFVACLSMLISVHARSASGAVVGAYIAGLAWLVLPVSFAIWLATPGTPASLAWLGPVVRGVARSSPLSVMSPMEVWGLRTMSRFGWAWPMAGLQGLGGLALLALAAWRLRPVYRAQVGGVKRNRLAWLARAAGLRGRPRPPCGDDPMAWKERYAPESAWLARLSLLVGLALVLQGVRLHFFTNPDFVNGVFDEMFRYGLDLGEWGAHGSQRAGLNSVLGEQAAILFGASLVASAILAASGVAGERGRGTWSGLLGTPLERRGILRAKMWGAIRPVRVLLGLMLVFYIASMAATALHPVGFVMAVLGALAFLWFGVALGTWVSIRSSHAPQAIVRTVILLAAVNLAPVAALAPFAGHQAIAFATPLLLTFLPMSRMHFQGMSRAVATEPWAGLVVLIFPGIIAAQAVGAWLLTRSASRRIEWDEG
jgi:ABC-type transport system involved in multi-copper enzyme maturation permease subunit